MRLLNNPKIAWLAKQVSEAFGHCSTPHIQAILKKEITCLLLVDFLLQLFFPPQQSNKINHRCLLHRWGWKN